MAHALISVLYLRWKNRIELLKKASVDLCFNVLECVLTEPIQATRSPLKTVADIWLGDDGISCPVMSPLIKSHSHKPTNGDTRNG